MSRFVSLAGEQVAELANRAAEAGRLSRGRTLFRKGAVSDLAVSEGSIIASVRGSEGDKYETTISTALAPPGVVRELGQARDPENPRSIEELIDEGLEVCPRDLDLVFGCNCADWDEPCKHVVAVILAFADRVDLDESELLRWRGIDLSFSAPTEPPSEATPPTTNRPAPRWRRRQAAADADAGSDPDAELASELESSRATAGGVVDGGVERGLVEGGGVVDHGGGDGVDGSLGDRSAKLSELEALLGDTVMRVPSAEELDSDSDSDSDDPALDPAMANFLGVGMTIDPIDVSNIPDPAPLFADVQLGPLADLGPELAKAVATIKARTEKL